MAKGTEDHQQQGGNKKTKRPDEKRRYPIGFDPRREARRERAKAREEAKQSERDVHAPESAT